MPIECYLRNGEFVNETVEDFDRLVEQLDRDVLYNTPVDLIIKLLERFGKELTRSLVTEEGVFYLATWLRISNLNHYLAINLGDKTCLDTFVPEKNHLYLRAQPRGVVCHWVAGNVPTLAVFSLVQSILGKNSNIIRVPREPLPGVLNILKTLGRVEAEHEGQVLRGADVLKSLSVVYFPGENLELNQKFSLAADCKVIWGGKESVRAILALPQREHCESIVFGPKYSFAVVDEESVTPALCRRLAIDIITFEQDACSSPHVVFCESKREDCWSTAREVANKLAEAFRRISPRYAKARGGYAHILNARGLYLLDPEKEIVCSEELDWTILINDDLQLEEPVGSRTIYIKVIESLNDVIPLITNKIQTVGVALQDRQKRFDFCEKATRKGVARCVDIGTMNNYETPWDGILFINRLVRLTSMKIGEKKGSNNA
jgi:hypothetical protein